MQVLKNPDTCIILVKVLGANENLYLISSTNLDTNVEPPCEWFPIYDAASIYLYLYMAERKGEKVLHGIGVMTLQHIYVG